jgi:hypothetical protein
VDVRENGRNIGTSDTDKIMMAAGRHEIELVNETLGYQASRTVQVPPGKVASIAIEMPLGVHQHQRRAVGEVWIEGQPHRRNADRQPAAVDRPARDRRSAIRSSVRKRQAVSVTLSAPVRLSVDMK